MERMSGFSTADFPMRVVCVYDEASMRKVVLEALERVVPDIALVTCSSGDELLARLRELQPELILLDLKMKGKSGPDVIDALRARAEGKDIPIVFITAKTKIDMNDEYTNLGVIGVIHKPFDAVKLPETISDLWRAHLKEENAALPVAQDGIGH